MTRKHIHFLKIEDYEHPWDTGARKALEKIPAFTAIIKQLNAIGFERFLRIHFTGSSLKVTEQNFPRIFAILKEACHLLSIDRQPELYLEWDYTINGFTAGVEKPIVVLKTGCIDLLTDEELLFVISHELGHIKNKHVLYYQTASYLPAVVHLIGNATFGIGSLLTSGLQLALLNWKRMSEFTADRAGLLGCQDPQIAANALVKMAGLPRQYCNANLVNDFIHQAKEFESYDYDTLDQVVKVLSIMNQSHPWTVVRAAELLKWVDSGEYDRVLNKEGWKKGYFRDPDEPTLPDTRKGS